MTTKDDLADAREAFRRISEAERDNRTAWVDDVRFARAGEQWPPHVKRQRELDGRPCLTINRLPSFARQVINDSRQNRPAIKCHPVGDGANQETAEIYQGLIRNIEYTSDAEVAYDTALEHAVYGGFGYFRINTRYSFDDQWDQDLSIERISNPLSVYGDDKSTAADSSDWNVCFVTEMLPDTEFEARWGKKTDKTDFEADSKDRDALWYEDEKTRVAEWWTRDEEDADLLKLSDGTVMYGEEFAKAQDILFAQGVQVVGTRKVKAKKVRQRIISGTEVLEDNKWAGRYIPIVPVYGDEIVIEGKRTFVSLVRFAKDSQQMFNFWRTASTELVALAPKAPFIGPKGAFNSDYDKWATANTVSHPYIEYDGSVPPQRQPFAGPPAGALQEALNASDDMKAIMGLFDASLGAQSNETSGRAIIARQREGDVSTFNFIDNLSRAIRHAGRILVDMIPRVYNTERVIRVIHEDGSTKAVPVNQQFSPQQMPTEQDEGAQEDAQALVKFYDLTAGKYDITCEAGPSYSTQRQEAAVQMTEFIRAFPPAAQFIGDLVAKNMDWPGADDIAKRLKAMLPPQLQGANPQAQMLQQQMQMMDAQAKQAVGTLQQQIGQLQQQLQAAQTKDVAKQLDKDIEMRKLQLQEGEQQIKKIQADAALLEKQMQMQTMMTPPADNSQQVAAVLEAMNNAVAALSQPVRVGRDETGALVVG